MEEMRLVWVRKTENGTMYHLSVEGETVAHIQVWPDSDGYDVYAEENGVWLPWFEGRGLWPTEMSAAVAAVAESWVRQDTM